MSHAVDWRLDHSIPMLAVTTVMAMGTSHLAALISNAASTPQEQMTPLGATVMGSLFSLYFVVALGWGHFSQWRTGWRLFCGTPVLCRREMLHQWHLNTDTDPVWVYLRSTFKPWHYHNKPHSRQVTFLYRRHAVLFKLAWG